MTITPAIIQALCRGVKISNQRFEYPRIWFKSFRQKPWLTIFLRHSQLKRVKKRVWAPNSGYCPDCLATDPVPYWRVSWRMRHWVVCPKHHCVIRQTCPHCDEPIFVNSLSRWWEKLPSLDAICGSCSSCRKPLSTPDCTIRLNPIEIKELIAFQNAVISALILGSFRVNGINGYLPIESLPGFLATIAIPDPKRQIAPHKLSMNFQKAFVDAFSETRLPRFFWVGRFLGPEPCRVEPQSTYYSLPAVAEYVIKSKFNDPLKAIIEQHKRESMIAVET